MSQTKSPMSLQEQAYLTLRSKIIYADLDMQKVPASRMEHDVCGHYARPDVLKLSVEDK